MDLIATGVLDGAFDTDLTPLTGLENGDSLFAIVGCQLNAAGAAPTTSSDWSLALGPYTGVEDTRQYVRIYDGTVSGSPTTYTVTGPDFGWGQPVALFELVSGETIGTDDSNLTAVPVATSIASPSVNALGSSSIHLIWLQASHPDEVTSLSPPAGYSIVADIDDSSASRPQSLVVATKTLSASGATGNQTWTGLTGTYAKIAGSVIIETSGGGSFPTIDTKSINTAGDTLTITASEALTAGVGGNGGFALSTGQTLTYSSGNGTTTLVYSISPVVKASQTPTLAYTQPGNGWENGAGDDVQTFTGQAISNNSTAIAEIQVTDIYQPNTDTLEANTSSVNYVVFDTFPTSGDTENKLLAGTGGSISSGDFILTNDSLGDIGDNAYLVMNWTVSSDHHSYAGPVTVVNGA